PADVPDDDKGVGRPCDETFMNPCSEGLVCVEARCQVPKQKGEEGKKKKKKSSIRGLRVGMQNSFFLGFAGAIHNPKPAYNIGADFGFPTGRRARFHVELAYQDLNDYTGIKFNPLILGYG